MAAMAEGSRAIVGVLCDCQTVDGVDYDVVRARYLEALHLTAGVVPVLIPGGLTDKELRGCLSAFNGLLLTGAASNVSPSRYGGPKALRDWRMVLLSIARSVDGVIEAVSVKEATTFAAAVQWHPEWFHAEDLLSGEIFRAFGEACHLHVKGKMLQP